MISRDEVVLNYLERLAFAPYPIQEEALYAWAACEDGVLLAAPTGTGKTLVAEAAVYEGLVAGNWVASRDDLKSYLEVVQPQPIDVDHMAYDWVSANLHAPRTEADHPAYAGILMGAIASTGDHYNQAALSSLMRTPPA